MADLATLGLRVENGQAISELRQFDRAIDSTGKKAESLGRGLKTLAGYFGTGLIARAALRNIIEAQDEMALLENAVRATGGAAGRTVAQLDDMSVALQRTSRFSDEAAKGGLSRLVAYTSIQGAIFDRAAQAAVDFATAYRTDVTQAAESVGKALEYPEKGMQALQRQGFRLTEEQERLVKSLVATGEKAKAQEVVLGVLEEGMRGAALASRNTLGVRWTRSRTSSPISSRFPRTPRRESSGRSILWRTPCRGSPRSLTRSSTNSDRGLPALRSAIIAMRLTSSESLRSSMRWTGRYSQGSPAKPESWGGSRSKSPSASGRRCGGLRPRSGATSTP
jgi:IS5 family transposase